MIDIRVGHRVIYKGRNGIIKLIDGDYFYVDLGAYNQWVNECSLTIDYKFYRNEIIEKILDGI